MENSFQKSAGERVRMKPVYVLGIIRTLNEDGTASTPMIVSASILVWPSGGRTVKRCSRPVMIKNSSRRASTSPRQERRPTKKKITSQLADGAPFKT